MAGTTFGQKVKNEIREMIPVMVFFFIALELLALTQSLMLRAYNISGASFAAAAIGALIVAKVVLIADHLPVVNRFPDKPLIYNVIWKTLIYLVASILVRYVEHIIHFWRESDSFAEANRKLYAEVVWPHILAVQLWLVVLLLVYCSMRELVRALGREQIVKMFLHEPPKPHHHE